MGWTSLGVTFGLGLFFLSSMEGHAKKAVESAITGTEEFSGVVVKVSDGDTIQVRKGGQGKPVRVRLYGIDAPEKKQPFGEKCRKMLADQVAGKTVRVWVREQDRYGRSIGKVLYSQGKDWKDAGLTLLKSGCAWHYKAFEKRQTLEDRTSYAAAEIEGRKARQGVWSDPSQEAPWEFRRKRR